MAQTKVTCDQAVFTSIRSPMGEGYRIVAAGRGLKPEEKQAIIRCSPSHEALCASQEGEASEDDAAGVAFYALPSGRLCIAFTCFAGAEHTGRGGKRVFTHNVIFAEADFTKCGYNPFAVLRAMKSAGLTRPQLSPDLVLPQMELAVDANFVPPLDRRLRSILSTFRRRFVLRCLMERKAVAVELPEGWTEWTEALVLGIPGPLRSMISFGAGLRFSMGRGHLLQVFHDENRSVARRAPAQGICFVDSETSGDAPNSAWFSFVDRHWLQGDMQGMMRRASRPFVDCSLEACEQIGRLYNSADAMPQTQSDQILSQAARALAEPGEGVEREIRFELCDAAKKIMLDRLSRAHWEDIRTLWSTLLNLWRNGGEATTFAQPLIVCSLRVAMADDPLAAAEAALNLTCDVPTTVDRKSNEVFLDEVLIRLGAAAPLTPGASLARLGDVVRRWQIERPTCPVVAALAERCAALRPSEARL